MCPDISMCRNVDCPLRKKCYRFTASPNEYWQTISDFKYVNGSCDSFIDNKKFKVKSKR